MIMETLTALAEPNRFKIVELLFERPHSVSEICERLDLRQPQVSKHLRVLSESGVVHKLVFAQKRIYSLLPQPFFELSEWLHKYSDFWNVEIQDKSLLRKNASSKKSKRRSSL